MGELSRMVGVPWHVEKMTRAEGDARRHRTRCTHYNKDFCLYFYGQCRGAAHCKHYSEKTVKKQKESETQTKAEIHKKTVVRKKIEPFEGIKYIDIDKIQLSKKFMTGKPEKGKIAKLEKYIQEHKKLDKPIVVSCKEDHYLLEDKYLRYYVAKKVGLKKIPAETGTKENLASYDKLRTKGTLVWLKQNNGEVGEVVSFSVDKSLIHLDSGKTSWYDIHASVDSGNIRIL